jgi:hypothetical protein
LKETQEIVELLVMSHVDLLLGNDREISNHKTAVAKQACFHGNKKNKAIMKAVFSTRSVPRCYIQGQLASELRAVVVQSL